jgi:phosphoribosylformylglycinamidine synthase
MARIKALVLRAAGINCDLETEHALRAAGADAERLHINAVTANEDILENFQIIVFPGGFSYGDDVAAGKILANQIVHHLSGALGKFAADGKLILGICNGFQVLVKCGLLPFNEIGRLRTRVTITYNDSGRFEDRWVHLEPQTDRCVFIETGRRIYLPVAHGEGKVAAADEAALEELESGGHVAFKYVDEDGKEGPYPVNPNGSAASIAGLTDTTGRILGLMPHPERFVHPTQHPRFSRLDPRPEPDGMAIFRNAVKYAEKHL